MLLGKTVHYVNGLTRVHFAAIIVFVHSPEMVNLVTFDTNGNPIPRTSVPYSEEDKPFTWHWPEKI